MRSSRLFRGTVAAGAAVAAVVLAAGLWPATAADLKGEIRFSWWGGPLRNQKTDDILKLFEKENPGVKVLRETAGFDDHWSKLTIQSAAKNEPCTIQMQSRWLATYAKPTILRPLDDLLKSGQIDVRGISEAALKSGYGDDGHFYLVPSGMFYSSMMYNRTWLEKAGLKPPSKDWTWDDFAKLLRDIKPKLPSGVPASHNMGVETDSFVDWVQTQGYKVFDGPNLAFPKKVAIDWFKFWEGLRKEGLTDSPEVMVQDNGSLIEESAIANGRVFITSRPANRLDSHQVVVDKVRKGEQLDLALYPKGPGGGGQDTGSDGISIGANCPAELLPAAIAWVNFFTEDDRAAAIYKSDNGVVAVDRQLKAQLDDPTASYGAKRQLQLYADVAPEVKPINWPPGGNGAMTQALGNAYQSVAFETATPEAAADAFFAEWAKLMIKK
jgi:multiple sugar transport system substrate-binding protein